MTNAQIQDMSVQLQYIASMLEEERRRKPLAFNPQIADIIQIAVDGGFEFNVCYKNGNFDTVVIYITKGERIGEGTRLHVHSDGTVHLVENAEFTEIDMVAAERRLGVWF